MIHALGGGTGSGLGCLLLEGILDEYAKKITTSYCVIPGNKVRIASKMQFLFYMNFVKKQVGLKF